MSVTKRIWRGTMWTAGANVLSRIGTFLGNLAVMRLLGLELTGQLGLIESWLTLVTMFSLFGLDLAATKYISEYLEKDKERIGSVAFTALVLGSISSLFVIIITYAAFMFLPLNLLEENNLWATMKTTLQSSNPLILALILATTMRYIVSGFIYGLQAFNVFVTANMVVGLISFPLSYVLTARYSLNGALSARLILLLVELFFIWFVFLRTLRRLNVYLSTRGFKKITWQLISFGLPAFSGQLIANPVQTFMVSFVATQPNGLAQVGLLTIGKRLSALASFLPNAMATTVMPILSTEWGLGERGSFSRGISAALRMLWLSSLPVTIFFLAATPALLGLLYGQEFIAASSITAMFLIVQVLVAINQTGDKILAAANRMWLSTANNLIWMILYSGLALLLIPKLQALGYALAYLVSFTLYVTVQMWWLRRIFQLRLRPMLSLAVSTALLVSVAVLFAYLFRKPTWQLLCAFLLANGTLFLVWRNFFLDSEKQAMIGRLLQVRLFNVIWLHWQARKRKLV